MKPSSARTIGAFIILLGLLILASLVHLGHGDPLYAFPHFSDLLASLSGNAD